jgi:hypothetical protein
MEAKKRRGQSVTSGRGRIVGEAGARSFRDRRTGTFATMAAMTMMSGGFRKTTFIPRLLEL